ncbi:sensor histidine kinase [Serinibacter arcticus]|uniref:histidine kinase n=2 Tax=Serinibacter arcticus TaxID=1655435 RepID=A0A2U1ZZL3_9MICO|nr:sensor histidine kinase [Serinibacter arcticus]
MTGTAPVWLSMVVIAALTIPLAWRRSHPSLVAGIAAVAFVVLGEARVPELTISNVAVFMALYTVGAWESDRRRATWVRGAIIGAMFVWLLTSFFRASTADLDLGGAGVGAMTPVAALMLQQVLVNVLYFAGAYWFGNHAWNAARQRAVGEARAVELQAERARLSRQAVTIERLRIARELHDAVAHHVSLMGVQAAAARALLTHDTDAARTQIEALEDSSRAAVAELYELLGTLRDDEAVDPDSAPGVAELPALVAESRTAGLRLDLQTVGHPRPLPPLVSLNLYRIAQESLTNVVKHAGPGARASVRLRYDVDTVELEVSDDGAGRPSRAPGAGLGLLGMQERVKTLAGTLVTQPRLGGGFVVRASVPLPFAAVTPGRSDTVPTPAVEAAR